MTDEAPGTGRVSITRGRRRRGQRLVERITPGVVIGLLAAVLAFVLVAGVLRERQVMTPILVASGPINPGEQIDRARLRTVEIPESSGLASALLTVSDLDAHGLVAQRAIAAGEPVALAAVGPASARAATRVIALPLGSWGESGGELVVGDTIDVIDTRAETAELVIRSAAVVARSANGEPDGLIGSSEGVWVAIEVSDEESLRVAEVVQADRFVVVRSTGVEP